MNINFLLSLIVFSISLAAWSDAKLCQSDIAKFCKGVSPGQGKIRECLLKRQTELSKECSKEVQQIEIEIRKKNPCYDDVKQFCLAKERSPFAIGKCLEREHGKLSVQCQKFLAEKKGQYQKKYPCRTDFKKLCKAEKKKGSKCLEEKWEQLSVECKNKIEKEKKAREFLRAVCLADQQKYCSKVESKGGAVGRCLLGNKDKISEGCLKELQKTIKK